MEGLKSGGASFHVEILRYDSQGLFVAVDLNKGPLNEAACPTEVDLHVVREGSILA